MFDMENKMKEEPVRIVKTIWSYNKDDIYAEMEKWKIKGWEQFGPISTTYPTNEKNFPRYNVFVDKLVEKPQ